MRQKVLISLRLKMRVLHLPKTYVHSLYLHITSPKGFPGGSVVKNLTAKQETWAQSLGGDDPLEKGMATHSSILGGKIPWTEERSLVGYSPWGCKRFGHN